jgi:uncharacterized protein (TIGR03083 family)
MTASSQETLDLGAAYREARLRLAAVVRSVPDPAAVAVPACPGWSVHDVVSHLVAVVDDVGAGTLTGPPSDEQTAEQVARRHHRPTAEVLEEWEAAAPWMEQLLSRLAVWPALLDVVSHEHDVRGALGAPGARDVAAVRAGARFLLGRLRGPLVVEMDGERHLCGNDVTGDRLTLRTSAFETLRFRMGRRSRAQLRAMDWTGDPSGVLDQLTIFGPSASDIVE